MFTLIIFTILCAIEFAFVYMKWNDIQDYKEIGEGVANITKLDKNKHYSKFVKIAGWVLNKFKVLLIIPLIILLLANLIASSILGTILYFIF